MRLLTRPPRRSFVLNATQAMVFNPQIFMLLGIGAARRDKPARPGRPGRPGPNQLT